MALKTELQPGFMVFHANHMEDLRTLVSGVMQRLPLGPLEEETILTQSRGMSEWLKNGLAAHDALGIAASLRGVLPSSFQWECYRAVLGEAAIQSSPLLERQVLRWRLMAILPEMIHEPAFAPLAAYLEGDTDLRKLDGLAARIADLFDQYQVYRADWLQDWANGRDQLEGLHQTLTPVQAQSLAWQAPLWRRLLQAPNEPQGEQLPGRADVHRQFLKALENADSRPPALVRRVIVFGLSTLAPQMLEVLDAMAPFVQIVLCVQNPCEHYWGDLTTQRRVEARHALKKGVYAGMAAEDLHLAFQPLLAAWGRQGQDYMALLAEHDDHARLSGFLAREQLSLDLFEPNPEDTLLGQLQNDVLQLRALDETRDMWEPVDTDTDYSLRFQSAHGMQREVEILHDQLLWRFAQDDSLTPADVVVMVPNIDQYAPHIQAVFGQYSPGEPQYLPFVVSDQGRRGFDPVLLALEQLLHLPTSRMNFGDMLLLLDVAALRARFGLQEDDVALLARWSREAGARWGLDAHHRESFDLRAGLQENTWDFAMRRMLLGYMLGADMVWDESEAYAEVAGLQAPLAGTLFVLLEALVSLRQALVQARTPEQWGEVFRDLLERFFEPVDQVQTALLREVRQALAQWLQECQNAGFDEEIPLEIARKAWLEKLDDGREGVGFLSGRINFCTLLPMRSIPFRVVCLLGMNDGDFPRADTPLDFDLLPCVHRTGDRSRRDDDHYLFLEAILSAREQLYISWIGRSNKDNTPLMPSVLVGQLREHLDAGWQTLSGEPVSEALTVQHPLQPFSRRYFDGSDAALFTYARQWLAVHAREEDTALAEDLSPAPEREPIDVATLVRDLKVPIKVFFRERYKAYLSNDALPELDHEPFGIDRLQSYQILSGFVAAAREPDELARQNALDQQARQWALSGMMPLCGFGQQILDELQESIELPLKHMRQTLQTESAGEADPVVVDFDAHGLSLRDHLHGLFLDRAGQLLQLTVIQNKIWDSARYNLPAMLEAWVRHVVIHAMGHTGRTVAFGLDGMACMPSLPQELAQTQLFDWLGVLAQALQAPLPVSIRTASAWANPAKSTVETKVQQVYGLGDTYSRGEVDWEPLLGSYYPDAHALMADGRFERLSHEIAHTFVETMPKKHTKYPKEEA